jgi:transketolase
VSTHARLDWPATDERAVDLIRVLAMDSVQKAGSGHPGTAMSLAPAAYLLFQRLLRHDPNDPQWPGRDRFVLSCGHSSLTLYIQLYLSGYGLTLDDLKSLRTWGSSTPGHPEHGLTPGVETTTGPLGQGIGNAVGMAMAARRERGLLDPDAGPGTSPFDHFIYCFVSDGDIEEGISHEVSSLAGHHRLGNLIVLYDDNQISIEDNTNIAKSEDVCARYEAYGWHVQKVDWRTPDGGYHEDVEALYRAFLAAREHTQAPSFIALRTIIGWPGNPHGRTLHFGIREHGMGAILNGIALHGGTRPYGGTFLVFSDYIRPSVRLAALMEVPVTYVWTHDSIGLGEDGPTHQPIEHQWALRNIPQLEVVRPGDANEAVVAWRTILERARPAALCLTRQNLPVLDRSAGNGQSLASAEGVARGGYVLAGGDDVILIATGSEVAIALEAREQLAAGGVSARVVSMPCVEWFENQDESYRREVLPAAIRARVSVEAGITAPWRLFTGEAGASIGVDHFGASADYKTIYREFGITADRVAAAARDSLARV